MKNQPRKFWNEITVVKVAKLGYKKEILVVTVGADDPTTLETERAKNLAVKVASKKGFKTKAGFGEIKLFGQNALTLREFYYEK